MAPRGAQLIPEMDQIFTEVEMTTLEKVINETWVMPYGALNLVRHAVWEGRRRETQQPLPPGLVVGTAKEVCV